MPNALVLFNPVYDNGPDGYGYDRVKDYYKKISPLHNLDGSQPPTIVFLGDQDKLIPVKTAERYEQRMKANGNRCETIIYKDQGHGFFNLHKNQKTGLGKQNFTQTMTAADKFLASLGFLSGEPSVEAWLEEQEK